MADKKISQFPTFDGTAGSGVFFVVGSGDSDNPNASNYRYPFNNLTTDITQAGSPWTTGADLIYTLTGAVGLGTSAPIYQLDVANTGRFRSDLIVSGDLFVSGTTHIQKVIDASITGTISGITGEFSDGIFTDSLTISGQPVLTGTSSSLGKWTDGAGGDIYYNGGNVGIGTSTPTSTSLLDISKSGDFPTTGLVVYNKSDAAGTAQTTAIGFGLARDTSTPFPYAGAISVGRERDWDSDDANLDSYMAFSILDGMVSKEKVRIDSDGKVGIGTDNPTSLLTLSGDNADMLMVTDVGGTTVSVVGLLQDASNNGQVKVANSVGNVKATLNSTGVSVHGISGAFTDSLTVGIGTTNPASALHLAGASTTNSRISLEQTTANKSGTLQQGSAGVGLSAIGASNPIFLQTNGVQHFNLTSAGNVGIGTGTPSSLLHVAGDTNPEIRITDNAPASAAAATFRAENSSATIGAYTNDPLYVVTNNTTKMTVTTGGNVGIGTASPAGPLHVSNSADNTLTLTREVNIIGIANGAAAKIQGGALDGVIASMGAALGFALVDVDGAGAAGNTQGYLYFETKDPGSSLSEKMRIDESGRVGIGTATPSATLEVQANNDSPGAYAFWVTDKTHSNSIITAFENGDVQLGEFFYDDTSGNVGIGTPTPSAPLEISSISGGLIMPRMTTAQMNAIASPTNGEMIYNTSSGKFAGYATGAWIIVSN